MYPLKQSTAETIPIFVHDANGDGVPGLVDAGFTKRISKGGGAFAAMTVTITEMENGFYSLPLSTAHTDTLGVLTISISHASAKRTNLQFRVHARLPDDLAFPATSGRSIQVETDGMVHADLKEWLGTAPLALTAQRVNSNVGAMGTNVVTASALATDAVNKIADGVWDEDIVAAHGTDNTAGLVLSELTKRSVTFATAVVSGSIIDQIVDDGTATYNRTTDSLQAIRDRGDSAWITAVGFSTHTAADVWAVGTRTVTGGTIDTNNDKSGYALSAAGIDAIWDEPQAGHITAGTFGLFLDAAISSRSSHSAADVWTVGARTITGGTIDTNNDKTGYALSAAGVDAIWDEPQVGHVTAGTFGLFLDAAVSSRATPAQVNTEVLDVLTVDTFAVPGQATPDASPTIHTALLYLYKDWLHPKDANGSTFQLFNSAGTVVDQKAAISDAGGLTTKGLIGTGP